MNKKNFALVYFVSRSFFLGIVYSLMINKSGADSIIACLIGSIIGCLLIYIINKCNLNKDSSKLIRLSLYLTFLVLLIQILETYISSFFLVKTPKLLIVIPSVILCTYASFKSIDILRNSSNILFIISFGLYAFAVFALFAYFKTDNIMPFFTHRFNTIFESALIFAFSSAMPNILIADQMTPKEHVINYFITSIFISLICLLIIGVLTPNVAKLYRFPEYITLKRIKFFEFIENIENFIIAMWYIDIFYTMSFTIKRIYELINNKKALYVIIIFISFFAISFVTANYYVALTIYKLTLIILSSHFILLLISAYIKKLSKRLVKST